MDEPQKACKIWQLFIKSSIFISAMLKSLSQFIDSLNTGIGKAVSWLSLAMVLMTFFIVVMRYVFSWGNIALQDSLLYLFSALFMLGAAYSYLLDAHVRVDILFKDLSPKAQAWVNLLGVLLLLLPFCTFIFIISLPYVRDSWSHLEGSREAGGLDAVFILKSFIPIFAVLLALQGLSEAIKSGISLCNKEAK